MLEIKKNTIIALADYHKKIQQTYVLNETMISHSYADWKSTIKVSVCSASGEDSRLGLQTGVILLCSHTVERERDRTRNTERGREGELSSISSVQSLSRV